MYDGEKKCVEGFKLFVRAGENIKIDHEVTRSFAPSHVFQKMIVFAIYASSDPEVKFYTDAGVRMLGYLELFIPDVGEPCYGKNKLQEPKNEQNEQTEQNEQNEQNERNERNKQTKRTKRTKERN